MEPKKQSESVKVQEPQQEDQAHRTMAQEHLAAEAKQKITEDRIAADQTEAADLFAAKKLHVYEQFMKGKITRGALDRQIDELTAQKQKSSPAAARATTPRQPEAEGIVHRYILWSAGGGLIPFAGVDALALTAIQVLMVRSLCELYETPFKQELVRSVVTALVGSLTPTYLKSYPGLGTLVGVVTGPAFYSASTYAVGKVFVQHFESGGTLLTFDPAKMKEYFRQYYEALPVPAAA